MGWYKQSKSQIWQSFLGDPVRYMIDAHDLRVYTTALPNKITVSVTLLHSSFGTVMWQDFWVFKTSELSAAESTFEKVKAVAKDVMDKFRSEGIPTTILHSFLREGVRNIDIERKPSTRIPSINWARSQSGVSDWRSSIYGTRYPTDSEMF